MLEGRAAARPFVGFQRRDSIGRGVAIDPFSNQLANEPAISNRFALASRVQLRVEAVVDEAFALAPFDGVPDRVVTKAFALEVLPQPRLGAALPR